MAGSNAANNAGALRTIEAFKKKLRTLSITATAAIAARAAPAMTELAQQSFDAGDTAYGRPRPLGVDGKRLTLKKTGKLEQAVEFRATGRDIRTAPLPRYAKYVIAKYAPLPPGKAPLPAAWRERLTTIAAHVLRAELLDRAGVK